MTITRLRRSSRLLFHARYTDGVVDALTGQAYTFVRAGTDTATDSNGTATTYPHYLPRFEVTGGVPALIIEDPTTVGTTESLYYDVLFPPRALSLYARWRHAASQPNGARILQLSQTAAPYLRLYWHSSGYYQASYSDGSAEPFVEVTSANPSAGNLVEIRLKLAAAGMVMGVSISGGAEGTNTDATAVTFPAAWGSTRLNIASQGDATDYNASPIEEIKIHPDPDATLAELRSA